MKKCLLALSLLLFAASLVYAAGSPLDTLKTTWEQGAAKWTEAERLGNTQQGVWTRMQRPIGTGTTATATALPAGYDPNGEVLPFMKIVANNSGGRIRFETLGYSFHGEPIPLAVVGLPKAPNGPADVGDRVIIYWQCSIHGNENDATESSLIFLREVAQGKHDELLKDLVLLVIPTANPDGKNRQARFIADPLETSPDLAGPSGSSVGLDPNRGFSKAHSVEMQTILKIYRRWNPHILVDQHNVGGPRYRHIVSYSTGSWGNMDQDISASGRRYAESIFGDGTGKYAKPDTNFYKNYLKKFIEDYSPGNAAGNPEFSLSDATVGNNNTYSPTRNSSLSLTGMLYMDSGTFTSGIADDGAGGKTYTFMNSPSSDSTRSSATTPTSKNRYAVLMEINSSHHTWLKVHAQYAAAISAMQQASIQKDEIITFFKGKDNTYQNLNNSSPEVLTTIYQGAIDYRNNGNGAGGNEGIPFRKNVSLGNDMGWGPGIFRLDAYELLPNATPSSNNAPNRWVDRTYDTRPLLKNVPQYPIKMGAFYIMDPRATAAAETLMRQGVEVYKLKEDVALPNSSTYKFGGVGGSENWGVTKNRTRYICVFTTKMPPPRVVVLDNNGTALTAAQTPTLADAPWAGGGDWFMTSGHVAKAGYYVVPTAQKIARYAAFQMEPRSNCGLLFWGHWDLAVGGTIRGDDTSIVDKFNLYLVKTFDYTAIPALALKRVHFYEDSPNSEQIDPSDLPSIPSDVPTAEDIAKKNPKDSPVENVKTSPDFSVVTLTFKDTTDKLSHGMALVFYFYPVGGKTITVLANISEIDNANVNDEPSKTFEVRFDYDYLVKKGLVPGNEYNFAFADVTVDAEDIVVGSNFISWGTAFSLDKDNDGNGNGNGKGSGGCSTGFAAFALFALVPIFAMKKKK